MLVTINSLQVTPCSLVKMYQYFRGTYCLHLRVLCICLPWRWKWHMVLHPKWQYFS